jgi:hypothetical protein
MKATTALSLLFSAMLLAAPTAQASDWFVCGTITEIGPSCQLPDYPSAEYEYGIVYNSSEPHVVKCTYWNVGRRIYNRDPYFVASDNPQTGSYWGGFMFYIGTNATDDDTCGGAWRHRYWQLDVNNFVKPLGGNGCAFRTSIYCRYR